MAFLDNSGDIILDAVLTDTGRFRLAKGDGSFRITKFVFADDEINYGLYDKNSASGSAYYDLSILQTPVFEAFTNNASVVKSPLLSILNQNLLYLPVMKLNTNTNTTSTNTFSGSPFYASGTYYVTSESGSNSNLKNLSGIFDGYTREESSAIRVDQGLDTTELPATVDPDPTLIETQFIIELDYRLGRLYSAGSDKSTFVPSFVDDDQVASYYITNNDRNAVEKISTNKSDISGNQVIQGPRGTLISFRIAASEDLQTSTFLFTRLGAETTIGANNYYYIDTFVKVRGVTTGTSISIPIRFVRLKPT